MNRIAVLLIVLSCLMWHADMRSQELKDYFVQMPDSLAPLLSDVNRADFIDFLESKMKARVTNRFDGTSEMTGLSADYLCVRMTSQSTCQMKLLPVTDSTRVICVVSTVSAPAPDSHIRFYDTDWKPLPLSDYLPSLPVTDDFILPPSDTADVYVYRSALRQADMLLMEARLSADEATLAFSFSTLGYMEKEAADRLRPFVRREVVYRWSGGKFVRQ